jgi:hypothetical protein
MAKRALTLNPSNSTASSSRGADSADAAGARASSSTDAVRDKVPRRIASVAHASIGCGAAGITESAVVQDALHQYLDRTSDAALILSRLALLARAEERTKRDVEILTEAFGIWVKVWFAHTPKISVEGRLLARRSADGRYAQFVEHVSRRLSGGHRFIDDLPKEPIADEGELSRLAASRWRYTWRRSRSGGCSRAVGSRTNRCCRGSGSGRKADT